MVPSLLDPLLMLLSYQKRGMFPPFPPSIYYQSR